MTGWRVAVLVGALVLAGAACGGAATGPVGTAAGSPASASTTNNGVTVTVTLDRTEVRGGSSIGGNVAVTNETGRKIGEPLGCRDSALAVALSDGKVTTAWAWLAVGCKVSFAFAPGVTRLRISVITDYDGPTGLAPLPPGRYQAKLYLNRYPLPVPTPIPVTVT